MKIGTGMKVTLEYELTITPSGEVVESSALAGPLEYLHGMGKMLPALERRIEGLVVGDERQGVIAAREAYGDSSAMPVTELARDHFPAAAPPQAGQRFEAKDPQGRPVTFVVLGLHGDRVQARFVHPLADKDLAYRVKVLQIVDPKVPPPLPPG